MFFLGFHPSGVLGLQLWVLLVRWAFRMAQQVKNPPAMQETQVRSLGQEEPLEEDMETHSSILAWKIPWTEKPGGLWSLGSQRVRHDWATEHHQQSGLSLLLHWVRETWAPGTWGLAGPQRESLHRGWGPHMDSLPHRELWWLSHKFQ